MADVGVPPVWPVGTCQSVTELQADRQESAPRRLPLLLPPSVSHLSQCLPLAISVISCPWEFGDGKAGPSGLPSRA